MNPEKNAWDLMGLPRWKCHKVVNAAEILGIDIVKLTTVMKSKTHASGEKKAEVLCSYDPSAGEQFIGDKVRHAMRCFGLDELAELAAELIVRHEPPIRIRVKLEWMKRHNPQVGGYYVGYNDGYDSYSPKQAFEEGYKPKKLPPFVNIFKLGRVTTKPDGYDTMILAKQISTDGNRRGRAVYNLLTIPFEFAEIHGVPEEGDYLKWQRLVGYVGIIKAATKSNASFIPNREAIDMEFFVVKKMSKNETGVFYTVWLEHPENAMIAVLTEIVDQLKIKVGESVGILDDEVAAVVRNNFVIKLSKPMPNSGK